MLKEAYIGLFPKDFRKIYNLARITEIHGLYYDLMVLRNRSTSYSLFQREALQHQHDKDACPTRDGGLRPLVLA